MGSGHRLQKASSVLEVYLALVRFNSRIADTLTGASGFALRCYVCMHVCVYSVCVYIYIYIYIHMYVCIYMCIYIYIYV